MQKLKIALEDKAKPLGPAECCLMPFFGVAAGLKALPFALADALFIHWMWAIMAAPYLPTFSQIIGAKLLCSLLSKDMTTRPDTKNAYRFHERVFLRLGVYSAILTIVLFTVVVIKPRWG